MRTDKQRKLIVEVDEEQHRESTPFFDKPHRMTVSGVHRGEQRRVYDERKRAAARAQGYRMVAVAWSWKRERLQDDVDDLASLLTSEGIEVAPRRE